MTFESDQAKKVYELTPTQRAMFHHALGAPASRAYFDQICYSYSGALDVTAFEKAWESVIDHHPILRTSFRVADDGRPMQEVHSDVELLLAQYDWRGLSSSSQEERLALLLQEDRRRGFDLSRAPLLRLALVRTESDSYRFLLSYHQLIMDSWSMALVRSEVSTFYHALRGGGRIEPAAARGFGDYVEWLGTRSADEAEAFWRRELSGFKSPNVIAIDRAPGASSSPDDVFAEREVSLPVWLTAALQSLARSHRLTMNTLVQGAWAVLLNRYCGSDDLLFGITISGRPRELIGSESILGPLSNVQPMRAGLCQQDSILTFFRKVQGDAVIQRAFEHASLKWIQEWSEVPSTLPLLESVVAFESFQTAASSFDLGGRMLVSSAHIGRTSYPLFLMASPGDQMRLQMIYQRTRFDDEAVERMLHNLAMLFDDIMENPERSLGSLKLLTEVEKYDSLVEWNRQDKTAPIDRSKLRLILPVRRKAG